jgi:alpha-L-arabinofuranosidase
VTEARETEIGIRGGRISSAVAVTLTHSDIHVHNSFDQINAVRPQTKDLEVKGRVLVHTFPPASVTKLTCNLA